MSDYIKQLEAKKLRNDENKHVKKKEQEIKKKNVDKNSINVDKGPNKVNKNSQKSSNPIIIDYNDLIQFCKKYRKEDIECEQFFRHAVPRIEFKKEYGHDRGGGGWSGGVKATINILNKMKKRGLEVNLE